jgi:arabinogalactan endo-1,4-beta-galactosidase
MNSPLVIRILLVAGLFCRLAAGPVEAAGTKAFLAGADLSLVPYFQSHGVVYREQGRAGDPVLILKQRGVNCVRLRLFTSSPEQARTNPYNAINNRDYTLPLARHVKECGLQLLLDFHYSDTWADPQKQFIPAAWAGLDFPALVRRVHDYTRDTLADFRAAGAAPEYVQIGNEITAGLLWPAGHLPRHGSPGEAGQWSRVGQLLSAASEGVRDGGGSPPPRIIVHIDRGGDASANRWFFDQLIRTQHVPFDIIGESYYPFWHGSREQLAGCLAETARRYGKPVMVAETAFPWTSRVWSTNLWNEPPTPAGQARYLADLTRVVHSVPGGLGAGVFWWGAEYQPLPGVNEAGLDTTSLFDDHGEVLPAAAVFRRSGE